MRSVFNFIPGFLLVSLLAVIAFFLSKYISVSANLIAILLGFLLVNVVQNRFIKSAGKLNPSIKWCESKALAIAVALLGAQLNVSALLEIKPIILILLISGLLVTFVVTLVLAKLLKVGQPQAFLIASGQGICGSAAVMASQSVIKAPTAQAGLVVALVNFLGFVGVFAAVGLAKLFFQADDYSSGVMIGNTLQSMGHVVAAGFSINDEVGQSAVLVKMCRILLLIPVLLVLIGLTGKTSQNTNDASSIHWIRLIPLFIWVFLLLSFMATMQWLPTGLLEILASLGKWLFLLAMVAIGLSIRIRDLYQGGGRLLILGFWVFAVQLCFTVWVLLYI